MGGGQNSSAALTLQHTAARYNTLQHTDSLIFVGACEFGGGGKQQRCVGTATHCNALQQIALR